jgi:hypothetical protein
MAAPKRDNRRFTASRGMFGKGATYKCVACGKMTRETGNDESSLSLCAYCLEESYLENELSDEVIEQPEFEARLDKLQKEYKRGKYAKTEGDKKTRKIQSSKYNAPKDGGYDLPAEVTNEDVAGGDKVQPIVTFGDGPKVSVKLGWGIMQVMQLDDKKVLELFELTIIKENKGGFVIEATPIALRFFAEACRHRISPQYDQPLWYMSSADATAKKIERALKEAK